MKMMQVFRGGVIAFFIISLSSVQAQDSAIGCRTRCRKGFCCGARIGECVAAGAKESGEICSTFDGCDCRSGICDDAGGTSKTAMCVATRPIENTSGP